MSLQFKLYFVLFFPFMALLLVHTYDLHQIIRLQEDALAHYQETTSKELTARVRALINHLDKVAIVLSRPREIVKAVQAADNDVLFDWSRSFIGDIDSIYFSDPQGIVLARAPDEFRFGDDVSDNKSFFKALEKGSFQGVGRVDGKKSLVASKSILQYDDVPVGVVCIAIHFSPSMLAGLIQKESMALSYIEDGRAVISSNMEKPVYSRKRLNISTPDLACPLVLELAFFADKSYMELLSLKRSLLVRSILALAITLPTLLILIRGQVAPYLAISRSILDYSAGKINLEELGVDLGNISHRSKTGKLITEALCRMVDTIQKSFSRIEEYNEQLRQMARVDPLTKLWNRRYTDEVLLAETERATRYNMALSVLLIDIDHFKEINDQFGHQVGDVILTRTGEILKKASRSSDAVGRWGGEEFIIICPGISGKGAKAYAEKLCQAIENEEYQKGLRLTASIGVTQYQEKETISNFVARADKALYQAKSAGRNLVCQT